ncbi:hypothetical protein [Devriesea agamarum]|uniref:hypothetical protein n=1 Tax=Devriesea agamarum TaxID=472569 RepID=UPI001E5627B4|nr:hypothetical protein [Devriesea agamarum]
MCCKKKATKKGIEQANAGLSRVFSNVGPLVTEGAHEARMRATDFYDTYSPVVADRVRRGVAKQNERVMNLAEKINPNAAKLREDVRQDYLPRAKKTYGATNATVQATVAAAVDAARKEWEKGYKDIHSAVTTPTKRKKKRSVGKTLFLLTLVGAGAAAGYVAWKKTRPIEDPWAPPADFARAHYPAAGSDDKDGAEVSDTVAGAEAGDVAGSLTSDTAAEKARREEDEKKRGTHRGDL